MRYNSIYKIQQTLKDKGYYRGHIDGQWGPLSDAAIQSAVESGSVKLDFDFATFKKLFKNRVIYQSFVNSVNHLMSTFNDYNILGGTSPLNAAYMLATSWHETAYTMKPIKEYGGWKYLSKYDTGRLAKILGNTPEADGDGQFYAGRGHVMITGKDNYRKFALLLDIDLLKNPDLALDLDTSAKILTIGSLRGMFTTKKLSDYIIFGRRQEFINARRVINGTDDASAIATHAQNFVECLVLR